MICPLGTESDIKSILALEEFTDLAQWQLCLPHRRLILLRPIEMVGKLDVIVELLMCTFLTKRISEEERRR
jgi:hypothetical protein